MVINGYKGLVVVSMAMKSETSFEVYFRLAVLVNGSHGTRM